VSKHHTVHFCPKFSFLPYFSSSPCNILLSFYFTAIVPTSRRTFSFKAIPNRLVNLVSPVETLDGVLLTRAFCILYHSPVSQPRLYICPLSPNLYTLRLGERDRMPKSSTWLKWNVHLEVEPRFSSVNEGFRKKLATEWVNTFAVILFRQA
jgi:hypothetical protein